jgi:hypothetical protein
MITVGAQGANVSVPIEQTIGAQRPEVVHCRDERTLPSAEPMGAEIGKQVVHVDDVGRELIQIRRGIGAKPRRDPYPCVRWIPAFLAPAISVPGHEQHVVPSVPQNFNLGENDLVLSTRLKGGVETVYECNPHGLSYCLAATDSGYDEP